MALTIKKSMDVSNFWVTWGIISALVKDEYRAVQGMEGFYDLKVEIIWDTEDDEGDALAAREAVRAYRAGETVPWEQAKAELANGRGRGISNVLAEKMADAKAKRVESDECDRWPGA